MKRYSAVVFACLVAVGSAVMIAQSGKGVSIKIADGDWPNYNRDLAATRYSPLKQITTVNVATLKMAWSAPVGAAGSEEVPLVVGGIMYVSGGRRVAALDGATGKEIWVHELPAPATPAPPPAAAGGEGRAGRGARGGGGAAGGGGRGGGPTVSTRGLGYWPGDGTLKPRILFMAGNTLRALDADTGMPSAGFGDNGVVSVGVPYNGTPTVYRNVAIIGAAVNEVPQGPPGNPRAFDVRTGQKLWEFQTVPKAGEKFNETWGDGWKDRSGTNMWGFSAAIDADRSIAYLPIAGPAANYYGGDRPGNNVYANSIVALDPETGQYKWHFQTVHHDIWDSDMPSVGSLINLRQNGRTVPAIANVGKTSWMFILDRTNGKPVFGVEERPVPKGDVPTEWYSPTQPFPVKPAKPLSRVGFNKDTDLVRPEDTSAEHVAACQLLMERSGGYMNKGAFTPFNYHEDGTAPKSTIQLPGGIGGVNWGGPAADPTTGFVYAQAHDTTLVGWVEKKKEGVTYSFEAVGSNQAYDRASIGGVGPFFTFTAPVNGYEPPDPQKPDAPLRAKPGPQLPCTRPPWAKLVAINANTGEVAWESVLGLNEQLPGEKARSGNAGSAGPTVTGGGLVFIGATNDRRFRAFDSKTGKELWTTELGKNGNANPMTYQGKDGKQYVAIVATDTVMVYSLR